MTGVMERLRAADPCPDPVGYDHAVAQRNIDAIVRTDLTVGAEVVPSCRPRRRAWLAVAAVAVGLAVAGAVVGVEIARDDVVRHGVAAPGATDAPWETFFDNGISFEHPAAWTSYPPGFPSTMSWTVALLSTTPFPPVCTVTTDAAGTETTACHRPEPDLSGGGVLVDWTYQTSPGTTLDRYPGDPTTIAGVDAHVDRATLPDECTRTGAVAGVQAALATASNNVLVMTACVGPGDVDAALAAVDRMLASVQISP